MNIPSRKFLPAACMVSASWLILASSQLTAAGNTDAFPAFDSYIKITGQVASMHGDAAAFQARTGIPEFRDGYGIEDFFYTKDLNKTTVLTLDGHALSGSEDYLAHINVVKNNVGSADVGYKRFRTFYDGVGGFFPLNNNFTKLTPENLFVDRGEFWAEVKFGLPNQPEFKIRYTNGTRNGQKDSTIWGDSDNTGINYNTAAGSTATVSSAAVRKDIPSLLDVSERHQTLEGSIKHTMGSTTAEITLLGDWSSKNNNRIVTKFPNEAQLVTVVPGLNNDTLVTPAFGGTSANYLNFNNQVVQTTQDIQNTTTKGVNGSTVTELGPKLTLRLGAGYQDVSSDFGGDRLLATTTPQAGDYGLPTLVQNYYNVQNLVGYSDANIRTGNIVFDYKPFADFTASLGARGEDKNTGSNGTYDIVAAVSKSNPTPAAPTHNTESSTLDEHSITPVLDLRYSGIKDVALYSTVSHKAGDGTQVITPAYVIGSNAITSFNSDIKESNTDYTIGTNWRVASGLTLRAEPFFKDHNYHARGFKQVVTIAPAGTVNTPDSYELDSQFYGVKLTVVTKPIDVLSFTTRYIYQKGKMDVTVGSFAENDSMDSTSHTIGETIDWNPTQQFYMQASADVVFNQIATVSINPGPYTNPAGTLTYVPAGKYIQNSNNNYITYSVIAGAVISKSDDLHVQFTAYRATNSDAQLALYTQPYGSNASEYTVTVGLKHKFSDKLIGHAKAGYFNSHNPATGGNTNYSGPLAYVSLEYGL